MSDGGTRTAPRTLEELIEAGQVEAALLWDSSLGLTKRERDLVQQAFAKGLEIGKQLGKVPRV